MTTYTDYEGNYKFENVQATGLKLKIDSENKDFCWSKSKSMVDRHHKKGTPMIFT